MAFKESLQSFCKMVGDKTQETVQVTKLKSKISTEKSNIKTNYEEIGRYMYKKYKEEGEASTDLVCFFESIDSSKAKIEEYDLEIKRVKYED